MSINNGSEIPLGATETMPNDQLVSLDDIWNVNSVILDLIYRGGCKRNKTTFQEEDVPPSKRNYLSSTITCASSNMIVDVVRKTHPSLVVDTDGDTLKIACGRCEGSPKNTVVAGDIGSAREQATEFLEYCNNGKDRFDEWEIPAEKRSFKTKNIELSHPKVDRDLQYIASRLRGEFFGIDITVTTENVIKLSCKC